VFRDTKLRSPDYRHATPEDAVADFRKRIENYRKNYEALGPPDELFSYVKVIDAGTKVWHDITTSSISFMIVFACPCVCACVCLRDDKIDSRGNVIINISNVVLS
jgi:hypothetical protein